ncbi:MAG: outer membrane lipoprotein carrier protein LolA [Rhodospirillales bacterium]|nr:outer membrane lipoprotein carrier protein LolA [Rhodospirillales bacterium]
MPEPRRPDNTTAPSRSGRCRAWLWLALAGALLAALPAVAQQPRPAQLSAEDKAEIGRIENYLNGLKTLEARFLQVTSTGEYSEGRLHLARPGRLRIEYDPPVPVLIVANRGLLTYFDKELEQVSHVPLSSTPAGILVREKILLLSDEFMITGFERESQALRISLTRASDPQEGNLALVLADRPLELKKWMVTDAQGVTTTVSLLDARTGIELDPKLFEFVDPNFFKPRQE